MAWGAGLAAAYMAAAFWAWNPAVQVRVLFDGVAPLPPYHWVRPPQSRARDNQPPDGGAGSVTLTDTGSLTGALTTGDDQAAVLFPADAIAPRRGETTVRVTITPLDPAAVAPVPSGLAFDGNAYRIEAMYGVSRAPATFRKKVTVVLRFPAGGTKILRAEGAAWTALPSTTIPPAMQDVADTDTLGVFVAAGPVSRGPSVSTILYRTFSILLWSAAVVLMIGLVGDYMKNRCRGRPGG
jgi:hypothetical protein